MRRNSRVSKICYKLTPTDARKRYKEFLKYVKGYEKDTGIKLKGYKMMEKPIKKRYIRNKIVYDPNIPETDVFDYDHDSEKAAKSLYKRKGKSRRKVYHGV